MGLFLPPFLLKFSVRTTLGFLLVCFSVSNFVLLLDRPAFDISSISSRGTLYSLKLRLQERLK